MKSSIFKLPSLPVFIGFTAVLYQNYMQSLQLKVKKTAGENQKSSTFSCLMLVLFACLYANIANAQRTASVSGNWNSTTTWGGAAVPTAADAVTINNGVNVTLNVNAVCASFTINGGDSDSVVLTSGTNSLTVTGAVTINAGTIDGADKYLGVGSGSLSCSSVTIAATASDLRLAEIVIGTGTATVTGNITMNGTANRNAIRFSNSGLLNVGGNMSGGRIVPSTGTVNYNRSGSQSIGAYTYYNLTTSTSGTKTLTGAATVSNALTVKAGVTLANGGFTLGTPTSVTLENGTTGSTISGSGLLTLGGNVTVNNISGTGTGATISCPVALGDTRTFTTANEGTAAADLTISGIVSTAFGLTKAGAGKMVLAGANTYSGLTTVSTGVLALGASSSVSTAGPLGTTGSGTTVASGAVLDLNGFSLTDSATEALSLVGTGISSGGALTNTSSTASSYNGLITLPNAGSCSIITNAGDINLTNTGAFTNEADILTIGGTGTGSIAGAFTANSRGITKTGAGTWTLSGASTYGGPTLISAGTLKLGSTTALGSANGLVTVASGGALDLNGYTLSINKDTTINGTGVAGLGAMTNSSPTTAAYPGIIVLGSNASIVGETGSITISNTSQINGTSYTLTLGGATGGSFSANLNTGTGGLIKSGTGTWTVNTHNYYNGTTTISAGTLKLGIGVTGNTNDRGPLGSNVAGTTVATGAVLDLNGFSINTSSTPEALTLNGSGISNGGALTNTGANATFNGAITLASNSTITATTSGSLTCSGAVAGGFGLTLAGEGTGTISGIISTPTSLTKNGAGTWTLSGNNTYTGTTTLSAGVLELGAANRIANTSPFTYTGGTFSTGATTGFSETVGVATLSANSTIKLGTGVHTLTIANSSAASWGAFTLTINGWTGTSGASGSGTSGKIQVGTGGLTAEQLAKIQFTGFLPGATITASGELVPPTSTYYSQATGAPNTLANWNTVRTGGGSSPANFTTGDIFIVQNGHTLSTNAAWSVSGTASKVQVESGGTLVATSAITLSTATTFQIDNGGTYTHSNTDTPSSTIFNGTESFGVSSNVVITNWRNSTTVITTGVTLPFGNLQINWTANTNNWQQGWNTPFTLCAGNFTVTSTGTGTLRLNANTPSPTITIAGNYSQTGGTVDMASGSSLTTLNVGGHFTHTGGTITESGSGNGTIVLNGSGAETIESTGFTNTIAFTIAPTGAGTVGVASGKTFTSGTATISVSNTSSATEFTNNGTLAISSSLGGAGIFVNAGTFNSSGTISVNTLDNSGTMNITGSGATSTATANFTNTGTLNLGGSGAITGITNNAAGIVNLASSGTITAFDNATATSTLNISTSSAPTITTLTTSAAGNTVNYNRAGNQTVKVNAYSNLILSGSGAKTCAVTTVNNDFTLSGTATVTHGANLAITRDLLLNGGAFTTGAFTLSVGGDLALSGGNLTTTGAFATTVTGTTTITSGTLTLPLSAGNKTFTGLITLNGGTLTGASTTVVLGGGITNNSGAVTLTGTATMNTTGATFGGANPIAIATVSVNTAVAVTNNGTLTVGTALNGSGSLNNTGILNLSGAGAGSCAITTLANEGTINRSGAGTTTTALANFTNTGTLNISGSGAITGITNNAGGVVNHSGSSTITSFNNATATSTLNISTTPTVPTFSTLTVSAAGNTVNYTGTGTQAVKAVAFSNLTLSGSGAKSIVSGTSVTGTLSIAPTGSATASVGTGLNIPVGSLLLAGVDCVNGTWGYGPNSPPYHKNQTYFANTTGYVTVSNGLTLKSEITGAELGNASWCAGETRNVTVTIKNIGTATWTDGTNGTPTINIGVKWNTNGSSWDDYDVRVSAANLAPGQTATYTLPLTASDFVGTSYGSPLAAGSNNITFDVVQEGIVWFAWNREGVGPGNTEYISPTQTIRPAFTAGAIATTSQTICSGGTPTVIESTTAASGGDSSITYSWRSSADDYTAAITNETAATYTPPAGLTATTSYRRYAKDGTCSTTPTVATGTWTVTIGSNVAIGSQSTATQTRCISVAFSPITVTATGVGLTYQWYSNTTASTTGGTSLATANGAQTNSYTPQSTTAGTLYYYCIVSGTCGTQVTSAVSGAFITNANVAIGSQSTATQTRCISVAFSPITVTATGLGLTYQWFRNTTASTTGGTSLSSANGAQTNSYTPQSTTAGTLYYYCVVSGTCGTQVTSAVSGAFITNANVAIGSQSTATQTRCISVAFSPITVTATGVGLTYQWFSNATNSNSGGTSLAAANGAQTNSYTPQSTTAGTLYYYCVVSGTCGTQVTSAVSGAFITNANVAISSQSTATQTQCISLAFTPITVTATGVGLTYQWYRNTTASTTGGESLAIANGARTNSYTPQSNVEGTFYYYCIVSGTCGTAVTSAISGAFNSVTCGAFVTKWNLATTGTSNTTLSIGTATSGTVNYYWQEVSPGTATGSGTFSGTSLTINNLPANATIRLGIYPTNFQRINIANGTDKSRLLDVEQWGSTVWTGMQNAFQGCNNLNITATDLPVLTSCISMEAMFQSCTNLNGPTNINSWNTAAVTSMNSMFSGATIFNQNIGSWNTAAVTNMLAMFASTSNFNQNIGSWNTVAVNSMVSMFDTATAFNQNIGSWNTAAVTSMNSMFKSATAFNQNIGNWNTAAVTNMQFMFTSATTFNQNISSWNTGAVTAMSGMFDGATAFNQNIGSWNTAAVTLMSNMFRNAVAFNQNIGNWNTAAVSIMAGMFDTATAFNQNLGNWNLKSSVSLTNMLNNCGMDCTNYAATLVGWNANASCPTGRTLGATGRTYGTAATAARANLVLATGSGGKGWTITDGGVSVIVISSQSTAAQTQCISLAFTPITVTATGVGLTYQWYSNAANSNSGGTSLGSNNGAQTNSYTPQSTTAGTLYYYCVVSGTCGSAVTSAVSGAFITNAFNSASCGAFITKWNLATAGSGATQLSIGTATNGTASYYWQELSPGTATGSGTFSGSTLTISGLPSGATIRLGIYPTNFESISINNGTDASRLLDVEQWGTTAWTSMAFAFYGCNNLNITATDLPVLTSCTSMEAMFQNCSTLNGPSNINSWNTSAVTTMKLMFADASAFNQNIGSWNTATVNDMNQMFIGASAFNQNIGSWNTAAVTNMQSMFFYATSFNQNIGNWNTANVTEMRQLFWGASAFNQNIGGWNTAAVTSMFSMFKDASTFNNGGSSTINNWNTAAVANINQMFNGATAFNQNIGSWNLKADVTMLNMLNNCGMDCLNYGNTLIGWNANPSCPTGRTFDAIGRTYSATATAARANLVLATGSGGKGWTITDGGVSEIVISSQSTASQTQCISLAFTPITVTATGFGLTYQWYSNAANSNSGGISLGSNNGAQTNSYTPQSNVAGTLYYYCIVSGTCGSPATSNTVTMTVTSLNTIALTSAENTNNQSLCNPGEFVTITYATTGATGATFTGLPAGLSGSWSSNVATISGTPEVASSFNYTITLTGGCGTVAATGTVAFSTTTWTMNSGVGSWSNGVPTASVSAVISGNYTVNENFTACTVTVNNNAVVTVASGVTFSLQGKLNVHSGSLIFEDSASLLQTNYTGANSGNIIYKRNTAAMENNYDFTYWGSPVANQSLEGIWMEPSASDTFYSFSSSTNEWVPQAANQVMAPALGYIARSRDGEYGTDFNGVSTMYESGTPWQAKFYGVPNNGDYTVAVNGSNEYKYNLLSNPYPSSIDLVALRNDSDNVALLSGNFYFWTHTSAITNNVYNVSDYAIFNAALDAGVNTNSAKPAPDRFVDSGQGFFAIGTANGNLTFKNDHRSAGHNNAFYRANANSNTPATNQSHKIWLNVSNSQGLYKQQLLAYAQGATNDYETVMDAITFGGNSYIDFYSIAANVNLTIQSRALPFEATDVVPLGFKTLVAGAFTIDLDHVDGLFSGDQNIYLRDNLLNITHNIKESAYAFNTDEGTFDSRFEIVYAGTTIITPTFTQVSAICSGASLVALPTTSTNGITGTWSPALNNTATTTYTFTPTSGQSASATTMEIIVNQQPSQPTLACYETATWNPATCAYDITGTQPQAPTTSFCYTFDTTSCSWVALGVQAKIASISGAGAICYGSSKTLTLAAGSVGTIQWQSSTTSATASDFTDISGTTNLTSLTVTPDVTTWYKVFATSDGCTPAFSRAIAVTVSAQPFGSISALSASVCAGSGTTLTLSAAVGPIVWQKATITNGVLGTFVTIPGSNGTTLATGNLTVSTAYRVRIASGVCSSATSQPLIINVSKAAVAKNINGAATICYGASRTLILGSGSVGTIQWQSSTTSATAFDFTNISGTTNLSSLTVTPEITTWYRVVVTSGDCTPAFSPAVAVTISEPAGTVSALNTSICAGTGTTLTLGAGVGNIVWQKATVTNGVIGTFSNITGNNATTLATGNLTASTAYRVKVGSGVCSSISQPITITVSRTAIPSKINGAGAICYGTSKTLTLGSGSVGTIQWQSSTTSATASDFTNISGTSNLTSLTVTPEVTTWFRVVANSGACAPAISAVVAVTVNQPAAIGTLSAMSTSICSGTGTTLTLSSAVGNIVWQKATAANGVMGTFVTIAGNNGTTIATGNLTVSTAYRAIVSSGGCATAISQPIIIEVIPAARITAISGFNTNTTPACIGTTTTLTLATGYMGTIEWLTANSSLGTYTVIPGATQATYDYVATSTAVKYFKVRLTSSNCSQKTSAGVPIYATTCADPSISMPTTMPAALPIIQPTAVIENNTAMVNSMDALVETENVFNALAYPNPSSSTFKLEVETSSTTAVNLQVYDVLGRLIENRQWNDTEGSEMQIGDRYPSGVYTILVTQGANTKLLRVIKK